MRALIMAVVMALLAARAARGQDGRIGVSVRIVAPEEVRVGGYSRTEPGRLTAPLTLTYRVRPSVGVEPTPGGPACSVTVLGARVPGAWSARLRCTPRGPGVQVVRLMVTPNA